DPPVSARKMRAKASAFDAVCEKSVGCKIFIMDITPLGYCSWVAMTMDSTSVTIRKSWAAVHYRGKEDRYYVSANPHPNRRKRNCEVRPRALFTTGEEVRGNRDDITHRGEPSHSGVHRTANPAVRCGTVSGPAGCREGNSRQCTPACGGNGSDG